MPSAARSNHAATCAAAPGNSLAGIGRLLGVSRSSISLEGVLPLPADAATSWSRPLTSLFLDNGSTKLSWSDHDNLRWSLREHGVCWRGRIPGTWSTWQPRLTLAGGACGAAPTGQAGPAGCRAAI